MGSADISQEQAELTGERTFLTGFHLSIEISAYIEIRARGSFEQVRVPTVRSRAATRAASRSECSPQSFPHA